LILTQSVGQFLPPLWPLRNAVSCADLPLFKTGTLLLVWPELALD